MHSTTRFDPRGSKTSIYLESPTLICLSLYSFYRATITIKISFTLEHPSGFLSKIFSPMKMGSKMAVVFGGNRSKYIKLFF